MKKKIKILFLGASKRVSLLERFVEASNDLQIDLEMFCCEKDEDFYPISHLAKVVKGPKFKSAEFQSWLQSEVEKIGIDIIIPNMDAATVALSNFKEKHNDPSVMCVVSSSDLCQAMEDKITAEDFFRIHGISTPTNLSGRFPKIAKRRFGFGAKELKEMRSSEELADFFEKADQDDWIIQDKVIGQETTVDFYVNASGRLIGKVLRDRLEVSDGEVMVCTTRPPSIAEDELIKKIASIRGWFGCITLQYILGSDGISVIEINPRFGGGATCAIEAGLDMPKYILSEFMKSEVLPVERIKKLKMTRARRDFFYEY